MKLALFLNIRFYFDGEHYTADERYYQFWTSLTRYFEKVVLCVPVVSNGRLKGNFDVDLKGNSIEICHLPACGTFGVHRFSKIRKIVSANIHQWDVVGAVVPNPVGLFFLNQAKRFSKPRFGYIRGNVKKTVWFELEGPKRWIGYSIYSMLDVLTRRFIRSAPTFTVGHDLHARYREEKNPVFEIVVSVISENQLKVRPTTYDACRNRLLYIGRLSSEKGIAPLMEGVLRLKRKYGLAPELTIAGSGPEEDQLKEYVRTLGIGEDVRFLGYVRDNAELSRLYQGSDVFILPSYTEGVPKVILEAMANGLPVVTTAVGGIPEIVQDGLNGLLVPAGDAEAICDSIHRILIDNQLRIKLIENAYETVKEYTIEKQTANIIRVLESYYNLGLLRKEID